MTASTGVAGKKALAEEDEANLKLIRSLASIEENKHCFDCTQPGPTYVNMTIGSYVCTTCSGRLRGLIPPHRVKSITMGKFSNDELEFLKARGNEFCRQVWLARRPSAPPVDDKEKMAHHMSDKYEKQRWYTAPSDALHEQARRRAGAAPVEGRRGGGLQRWGSMVGGGVRSSATMPEISTQMSPLSVTLPNSPEGEATVVKRPSIIRRHGNVSGPGVVPVRTPGVGLPRPPDTGFGIRPFSPGAGVRPLAQLSWTGFNSSSGENFGTLPNSRPTANSAGFNRAPFGPMPTSAGATVAAGVAASTSGFNPAQSGMVPGSAGFSPAHCGFVPSRVGFSPAQPGTIPAGGVVSESEREAAGWVASFERSTATPPPISSTKPPVFANFADFSPLPSCLQSPPAVVSPWGVAPRPLRLTGDENHYAAVTMDTSAETRTTAPPVAQDKYAALMEEEETTSPPVINWTSAWDVAAAASTSSAAASSAAVTAVAATSSAAVTAVAAGCVSLDIASNRFTAAAGHSNATSVNHPSVSAFSSAAVLTASSNQSQPVMTGTHQFLPADSYAATAPVSTGFVSYQDGYCVEYSYGTVPVTGAVNHASFVVAGNQISDSSGFIPRPVIVYQHPVMTTAALIGGNYTVAPSAEWNGSAMATYDLKLNPFAAELMRSGNPFL